MCLHTSKKKNSKSELIHLEHHKISQRASLAAHIYSVYTIFHVWAWRKFVKTSGFYEVHMSKGDLQRVAKLQPSGYLATEASISYPGGI